MQPCATCSTGSSQRTEKPFGLSRIVSCHHRTRTATSNLKASRIGDSAPRRVRATAVNRTAPYASIGPSASNSTGSERASRPSGGTIEEDSPHFSPHYGGAGQAGLTEDALSEPLPPSDSGRRRRHRPHRRRRRRQKNVREAVAVGRPTFTASASSGKRSTNSGGYSPSIGSPSCRLIIAALATDFAEKWLFV